MRVLVDVAPELDEYFESCARIRDITKTSLLNRLIDVIGRDQLVLGVLDDDSKPQPKKPREQGYRHPKSP